MPSTTELIESHKRVVMISVTGKVKVDPQFCDHSQTVTIKTGHEYTVMGEREDNIECYEQCLLCGHVLRDDGSWGPTLKCEDEEEIEF